MNRALSILVRIGSSKSGAGGGGGLAAMSRDRCSEFLFGTNSCR